MDTIVNNTQTMAEALRLLEGNVFDEKEKRMKGDGRLEVLFHLA